MSREIDDALDQLREQARLCHRTGGNVRDEWLEAREIDEIEFHEFIVEEVHKVIHTHLEKGAPIAVAISYGITLGVQVGFEMAAKRYIGNPL